MKLNELPPKTLIKQAHAGVKLIAEQYPDAAAILREAITRFDVLREVHQLAKQEAIPEQAKREQVRREHAEWSDATFGDVGPVGPLKHLSKEALEAAADPDDLLEWADMQFLLWDAQRRAGIPDDFITVAMIEKLEINKKRQWPEPKDGEPRLHINTQSAQPVMAEQWRSFVTDADIAALHRFAECCDDPESGGHDLEKEQVQRLEKAGALQRSGRISYITDFGDYLISATAPINAQQNEPQNIPENILAQPVSNPSNSPVIPDAYVLDELGRMTLNGVCEPRVSFGAGWNACRAEMLKAQQNELQNIPENIPAPLDAQDLELYVDILENSDSDDEDGELNNTQLIVWLKELQRRRALPAQPVSEPYKLPDGWVMVPEEATIAMLTLLGLTGSFDFMQQKYKNMLAAAPEQESE